MRTSIRRKGAIGGVVALAAASAAALISPVSPAGAVNFSNVCVQNLAPGGTPLSTDLTGTAPATTTPGGSVTLSNLTMNVFLPGDLFVAGYNAGLLTNGQTVPGSARVSVEATNTVEGLQNTTTVNTNVGPINITDPDGTPGTGDETGAPAQVAVSFPSLTFTAGPSGTISFREDTSAITGAGATGGIVIGATVGVLNVTFRCSPGTVDGTGNPVLQDPAPAFATTQIVNPPAAPVAANDSLSVPANQSGSVNVVANDTDINGNLNPASVTIVGAPTAGTATANPDGTVTYTNTNPAALSDSFTYTVADTGGLVSNAATVNVTILGDTCDATAAACDLDQVVQVQVIGATMTMKQAGALINLAPITLNGQPQGTQGALNGMTVTNARGTDAGWSVTGQMTTDFSDGVGDGVCPATDPTTWDNHCIPGANLGWFPSASVAHVQIPGDVASVTPGGSVTPFQPGLGSAQVLCSSPNNHSGGTFSCGGGVALAIPASAAAGTYSGTLTLTLA